MTNEHSRSWWPVLAIILVALAWFALAQATHPIDPPEDAYIGFRYARNLANGYGLVWNPGEDPVEGATEFIWVVMLAGMYRLGFGMEQAAWALNMVFGGLTIVLVALAAYVFSRRNLWMTGFAAGAFAVGPIAYHVRMGFATPLFTLLLALVFVLAASLALQAHPPRRAWLLTIALALASLFMGLTRPEGVIFAGMMILALLWLDRAGRGRLILALGLFLVLPGLAYFLWRWQYFGYPLPNTFYVKSAGSFLHFRYFPNIYAMFEFLGPFLIALGMGFWRMERERGFAWFVLLLPAFIFPWFYLLIAQLQNLGSRFQYPVYPVFLIATAAFLSLFLWREGFVWARPRWRELMVALFALGLLLFGAFAAAGASLMLAGLVGIIALLGSPTMRDRFPQAHRPILYRALLAAFILLSMAYNVRLTRTFYPSRYDDLKYVGERLQPFADKGYTLVSTEAGWLPYFSEWRTIDPFGLNDEYVAHNGLTEAYLDSVHPDVILYHDAAVPDPPQWGEMVAKLRAYAEKNGFILAAVIERAGPRFLHVYWVRADNPDAEAIIDAITGVEGFTYQYKAP